MLAAGMLAVGISSVKAQTADEIMDKHTKAVGGADNWNKIKTMKMVGSLNQGGMEINMTTTLVTEKALRMDISVMGMSGYQIITKEGGWAYMPFQGSTKIDTMKPEMVKSMASQMNPKSIQLIDYKSKGTKIELAGKDTLNNAPCYKLKCTNKEGETSFCYIDMNTYYLARIERSVKTDDQEQEMAVGFSNYQKLADGGIVVPMTMNTQGVDINYKIVEVNKPVDDKIFIPTIAK